MKGRPKLVLLYQLYNWTVFPNIGLILELILGAQPAICWRDNFDRAAWEGGLLLHTALNTPSLLNSVQEQYATVALQHSTVSSNIPWLAIPNSLKPPSSLSQLPNSSILQPPPHMATSDTLCPCAYLEPNRRSTSYLQSIISYTCAHFDTITNKVIILPEDSEWLGAPGGESLLVSTTAKGIRLSSSGTGTAMDNGRWWQWEWWWQ